MTQRVGFGCEKRANVHPQELLAWVAEESLARGVDRGEDTGDVKRVDDVVGILEQVTVASFGVAQRLFGAPALV